MNARSLRNKVDEVLSVVEDFDTDIAFIQETWLKSSDGAIRSKIKQHGFSLSTFRKPRKSDMGGGVATIYKSLLKVRKVPRKTNYKSFENLECLIDTENGLLRFINIYRPDYSAKHRFTTSSFINEFSEYIQDVSVLPGEPVFIGDFNIHVENADDNSTVKKFLDMLDNFGYQQLIHQPTHRLNGTLDLIFTRAPEKISDVNVCTNLTRSDHDPLVFYYDSKPVFDTSDKFISFRQWKKFDIPRFKTSLLQSCLNDPIADDVSLENAVDLYNNTLRKLIDEQCPVVKRKVKHRNGSQHAWFKLNPELKVLKRTKRIAHREYQKRMTTESIKVYKDALKAFNDARNKTRMKFNKGKIDDANGDLKSMYTIVKSLIDENSPPILPTHTNSKELANDFANFFNNKISKIRKDLESSSEIATLSDSFDQSSKSISKFGKFTYIGNDDICKLVMSMKPKNNPQDPIPTWLVKKCVGELISILSFIINKSLQSGCFPGNLKHASVKPSVKDKNEDTENKKNYRPVSNLCFLSKLLEKSALVQINDYINSENLHSVYQSGYRPNHSCETSVFKLTFDIHESIKNKKMVAALFLDMSAAFDTVDHPVLLRRLEQDFGFEGNVLAWFESYLANRTFSVVIDGEHSDIFTLLYGVPQGSLLGPLLFILYTKELSTIALKHGLRIQIYADDTTLYIEFRPLTERYEAFVSIKKCLEEIQLFLTQSFLKLNTGKTATTFFGSKYQTSVFDDLCIEYQSNTLPKEPLFKKTLGVLLDSNLTMEKQINSLRKACSYSLHKLQHIRYGLDVPTRILLIKTFVLSQIDYCNILFLNTPDYLIQRLQLVLNACIRFIYDLKRREHVTPYLAKAHILPVKYRIIYKSCMITYKVMNGLCPEYLNDTVKQYSDYINYNVHFTRAQCDVMMLKPSVSKNPMSEKLVTHWNSLPISLRYITELELFKKDLKTHLFVRAFY